METLATAYLGGVRVLSLEWVSAAALLVRFASVHDGWVHHFYAGRERIGSTVTPDQRSITARLIESEWPQHLTLMAVHPDAADQDFGPYLPLRPYNRIRARWTASGGGWSDAKFIDVYSSPGPNEAVDEANRLDRVLFDSQREYELVTVPMEGCGYWPIRIKGRDNKPDDGNAGTSAESQIRILAHPPDVVSDPRFTVETAAGIATVTCEI